jgi:hypothetical protein
LKLQYCQLKLQYCQLKLQYCQSQSQFKLHSMPANKQNWDLYYRDNVKAVINDWIVSSLQINVTWHIWPCACQDDVWAAVWRGWRYNSLIPHILNLSIRWRWVVSRTPQLLHHGENELCWTHKRAFLNCFNWTEISH